MKRKLKRLYFKLVFEVYDFEPVSVEDAPLRYASLRSGGEDKPPSMLLVLG